jgi:hypothetical protein
VVNPDYLSIFTLTIVYGVTLTYISPFCAAEWQIVDIYIADVAVSRNHRQFGDYTKQNYKQHNKLRSCN